MHGSMKSLMQQTTIRYFSAVSTLGALRTLTPEGTHVIKMPKERSILDGSKSAFTSATIPKFEAKMIDVDGVERFMYYADTGVLDTHTTTVPLIMIPGSAQTIESWGPHLKHLSKWRRVIIPEYRCQGVATSLRPEYSSMSQLVVDTHKLISHIGLSTADICGFSLGGRIALAYASSESNVARRVSVTGVPLVRPPLGRIIVKSWSEGLEADEMIASCWSFLVNGYSSNYIKQNYMHINKFVDAVVRMNDIHRLKHLFRFTLSEHPEDFYSASKCVERIGCPVQIIGGGDDRICDIESVVALHESIPGSQFTVVSKSGHLVPFEQPSTWRQALLKFLDAP